MLSGIGDREQLEKFDIPVIKHLPGVGKSLRDHPSTQLLLLAKEPLLVSGYIWTSVGFGRKDGDYNDDTPDFQYFWIDNALGATILPAQLQNIPVVILYVNILNPHTVGSVELASSDPFTAPIINSNYLKDPRDVADMENAVNRVRGFMAQNELFAEELVPGPLNLTEYILQSVLPGYHWVSTVKMGVDHSACVDLSLKVYGVEKLRVIDASVMPHIPRANTQASTMAIANRAAQLILKEYKESQNEHHGYHEHPEQNYQDRHEEENHSY